MDQDQTAPYLALHGLLLKRLLKHFEQTTFVVIRGHCLEFHPTDSSRRESNLGRVLYALRHDGAQYSFRT